MRLVVLLFSSWIVGPAISQGPYHPAVGQPGTSAIHKDSSIIVDWATSCDVVLGYVDIADTTLGFASTGSAMDGVGPTDGAIVSLGDSGEAIVGFPGAIYDGPGPDFAVFENSFSDNFLELAVVSVSSDGVNFFEFPCHSLTPDTADIGGFGATDPTNINNLAGKYRAQYGTPFDLLEMAGISGLDINMVTHIKLVDAVGTANATHATIDTAGNRIIDPYPTPFPSSGFDLDAVGVIHIQAITGIGEKEDLVKVYPNPFCDFLHLNASYGTRWYVTGMNGRLIAEGQLANSTHVQTGQWDSGVYILTLVDGSKKEHVRLVKI